MDESRLGRGRELSDGLGALGDGVLGELTREHQSYGRLDLARRQRHLLRVARELGRFEGDALENVVDERVHDRHALLRDARVGVDLLEDAVDVRRVRLDARLLLLALGGLLGSFGGFLGRSLGHGCICAKVRELRDDGTTEGQTTRLAPPSRDAHRSARATRRAAHGTGRPAGRRRRDEAEGGGGETHLVCRLVV